jgi:DNA-binding IclR family transcriptional regulator
MRPSPDYRVPALEKGLDLVEALAAAAVPQSLAELAVRLDRSSSELFRMLNCLERRGYIAREAVSGKYALSLRLYALAHAHSPTEKLLSAARRPMQLLTETSRESCHLSVLERGRLLVVAQEESPERVRLSIEVGGEFDPVLTASGRLLLAFVRNPGPAPRRLAATLEKVRRTGVSSAASETIEGVCDAAVLVGRPEANVMAALAVTWLVRRGKKTDETALLARLRATADEITTALGLSP